MSRQIATPIHIKDGQARPLMPMSRGIGPDSISEAEIQTLIHENPMCLPISEIDPLFVNPIPICMELHTNAGPIDNFMVTPSGLPVIVECKLWRNPEGRREVVGQILDYAKELSRWSSSDVQREVSRRLGTSGNILLERVRAAGHDVDEIDFNDAITQNLRRGRFLLLIVGDGIREGVEAIAEYLQVHAGLHFSLGLVELPIYLMENGERLVVPRVLTRTLVVRREVVAVPDGFEIAADESADTQAPVPDPYVDLRLSFLNDLVSGFQFSDPEQPALRPTPRGYLFAYMPAPKSTCWINVSVRPDQVGLWLVSNRQTVGDQALQRVALDWEEIRSLLGGQPELRDWRGDPDRKWIAEEVAAAPFGSTQQRQEAIDWLRERLNSWVSIFRPRIRSAVADIEREGS
jgi:hypothetical protein